MKTVVYLQILLVLLLAFFSTSVFGQESILYPLPTDYPIIDGYTYIDSYASASNELISFNFTDKEGSPLSVAIYTLPTAMVADNFFNTQRNNLLETTKYGFSSIYEGVDELSRQKIVWQSGYYVVVIAYKTDSPIEMTQAYLDLFPPAPAVEVVELNENQRIDLLYTDDVFANPDGYLNTLLNSREASITCAQNNSNESSKDVITRILSATEYPITQSLLDEVEKQCSETGSFIRPPLPLPYDIATCAARWKDIFVDAGLSNYDMDVSQECVIEAYSRENYLASGKSESEFESLLSERVPKVIELVRKKYSQSTRCSYQDDGTPVNCETVNGTVEPTTSIYQDGQFITETESQNKIFREENARNLKYAVRLGIVDGREVTIREEIRVQDGELVVNDKSVGVFPSDLDNEVTSDVTVTSVEVSNDGTESSYSLNYLKPSKLLFIFPVDLPVSINVNAQTGEYQIERPFWGFLAT